MFSLQCSTRFERALGFFIVCQALPARPSDEDEHVTLIEWYLQAKNEIQGIVPLS